MRPLALKLTNPRQHPESDLQRAVCQWWALQYPATWALTFHCPSGVAIDAKRAAIFRGLGWKRGVPDLLCCAAKDPYSGLALELKADAKAKPSVEQQQFLDGLIEQGWQTHVVADFETAKELISFYHRGSR